MARVVELSRIPGACRIFPPGSSPEDGPIVRFDPAALSQALVNLIDNAVKYSGDSRDIAVRLAASNGSVAIEVEDHGIGIAAPEQQRIFERFYRVTNGRAIR